MPAESPRDDDGMHVIETPLHEAAQRYRQVIESALLAHMGKPRQGRPGSGRRAR